MRILELLLTGEMFLASCRGFLNLSKRFRQQIVYRANHVLSSLPTCCCQYHHEVLYIFPSIWNLLQSEATSFSSHCGTYAFENSVSFMWFWKRAGPRGWGEGGITTDSACKHSVSTMWYRNVTLWLFPRRLLSAAIDHHYKNQWKAVWFFFISLLECHQFLSCSRFSNPSAAPTRCRWRRDGDDGVMCIYK